ncbi:MAG: hypothetical protein R2708_17425 [Vicinamibacterales bacterium]
MVDREQRCPSSPARGRRRRTGAGAGPRVRAAGAGRIIGADSRTTPAAAQPDSGPAAHTLGACTPLLIALVAGALAGPPQPPPAALPQPSQAPDAPILSPGPAAALLPGDRRRLRRLLHQGAGQGRWGADDELGTLNLVTPAKRKQAAAVVRVGQAVGLASAHHDHPDPDNASPFEHT